VLVGTALVGLRAVNEVHEEVRRITEAQADFQEADMAHDAMRAAVQGLMLPDSGMPVDEGLAEVDREVGRYLEYLNQIDPAGLPDEIRDALGDVRPQQEQYAADVVALSRVAAADPATARASLPPLRALFQDLTAHQGDITAAMDREAEARRAEADDAQTRVWRQLVGWAVAALVGMLGLTWLLHRLGGRLAATLARERGVAETLQHRLLPDRLPDVPGVRLAARYVPGAVGSQVGGDWYDVVPLPSGEVGLVMGDVVGHDLDAAADMGQLRNALRACAAEGAPPDEVLQQLNRLCLQQDLGGMATVLYAVLDPVLGTLTLANAGHYPPLLVTSDGARFLETDPRPPVGAVREVHYGRTTHRLPPGSLLVLYTDGLVERRDVAVEEGMARLQRLVPAPVDGDGLERVCDAVLDGMLGGHPSDDDVALLTVAPQALLGPHLDLMLPADADHLAVLRRTLERWLVEHGADDVEVYEITVACSEAATNAIEHAYGPGRADLQVVCDASTDGWVTLTVRDWGQWREARGRDRGRGVGLIHGLMDEAEVLHGDRGTQVVMRRRLAAAGPVAAGGADRAGEADAATGRRPAQEVDA
jgi:anti-sigma regulatory factor (Ser/Thr protein kinase)